MSDQKFSQDQLDWISITLERIRRGLDQFQSSEHGEPAHTFKPEAFDDN